MPYKASRVFIKYKDRIYFLRWKEELKLCKIYFAAVLLSLKYMKLYEPWFQIKKTSHIIPASDLQNPGLFREATSELD